MIYGQVLRILKDFRDLNPKRQHLSSSVNVSVSKGQMLEKRGIAEFSVFLRANGDI